MLWSVNHVEASNQYFLIPFGHQPKESPVDASLCAPDGRHAGRYPLNPPVSHSLEVFCDFDGTITEVDATDAVLNQFARPQWREWETLWQADEISGRECLAQQLALIRATPRELLEFVNQLPLDPGILMLAHCCAERRVPLTVVSDGLNLIVKAVLNRLGLPELPFYANRVRWKKDGSLSLRFPYGAPNCKNGACKCRLVARGGEDGIRTVYIGNGRSDFCVCRHVDTVYAKGDLIPWCQREGIPFRAFQSLTDVSAHLFPTKGRSENFA